LREALGEQLFELALRLARSFAKELEVIVLRQQVAKAYEGGQVNRTVCDELDDDWELSRQPCRGEATKRLPLAQSPVPRAEIDQK
jgi:hypothetical protein